MASHGELRLIGENYDPGFIGMMKEDDGYGSSDDFEGALGNDQDTADNGRPPKKKKKFHRHNPHQIHELESYACLSFPSFKDYLFIFLYFVHQILMGLLHLIFSFFKECPHPDEKQRRELSRRLALESKQIKFWFQNRRTQMKTQLERHENVFLKQENDKLRAENDLLRQAIASAICNNCGVPAVPDEISYEPSHLMIENSRLKDELNRARALTNKFLGRHLSSSSANASPSPSQGLNSNVEVVVRRTGFCGLNNGSISLPMGFEFGHGATMPLMNPSFAYEMPYDKSALVDVALAAMDELIKMAQMGNPLWIKGFGDGMETLNLEEYKRTFSSFIGMKPSGFTTEATRETAMVPLRGLALVDTLMDANRWAEMFPCMISRAVTIDVLSSGKGVTRDNALQLMEAEFQVLSPLVPIRQIQFIRFCKQHSDSVWAIVDVSINLSNAANALMFANCRRLPSGCVIQDMDNKYSKVTWVEHSEYDESTVHHLFRPLLSSGFGFGAQRWIATLRRQYSSLAQLMSPDIHGEDINTVGKKSMLKLAQRMAYNFSAGIGASSVNKWDKLNVGNVGEDVRVMTRKNVNDPGEPLGIVLSAATSVWMPITQQTLFGFLRNERMRNQWDILSSGRPMQAMFSVAKGPGQGNCVSILRGAAVNGSDTNMLILQETWSDACGALIVYAPVDASSIRVVMNGGDSSHVALLPSGFAILPGVQTDGPSMQPDIDENTSDGCILTVGFQILVNSVPTAKLTVESVETVNHLLTCTVEKIKAALSVTQLGSVE
ncbi:hypothetical protein ES288_D09G053500v1 [Gossypium darwinii]|uniref:Homeobox domain-containing protein n=1 Tax=Gossypium darwinii TaxID=34276 RepID=A0A5D2BBA1_GOSDA|nr:hypothetical protein ES288_D09G053500v1 [Gossypium darwinii]